MKKINIYIGCILCVMVLNGNAQIGGFRVTKSSAIQIGYQNYRWLGFGYNTSSPGTSQSQWAIEYDHVNQGLNLWKPFPSFNNGNYYLFYSDAGILGVGMQPHGKGSKLTPKQDRIHINGKLTSHGNFTFSDSSLKRNIANLDITISQIMDLRPVKYYYKENVPYIHDSICSSDGDSAKLGIPRESALLPEDNSISQLRYGLIAQEVDAIFPNLLGSAGNKKSLNYTELIPVLIKGFQEQQKIIDSQKLELARLRQEIVNWQGRSIDTIGQSKSRLFQNTPNPFDGTTTITYFIDESTSVSSATIEVRNIMGVLQSTMVLQDGTGLGSIEYQGGSLTPGYYIYTLKVNGSVKDSKMFLKEN